MTTTGACAQSFISLRVPASSGSSGATSIEFREGDGTGSANNMGYSLAYDASSNYLRLQSRDTDGCSANADIWRVLDGQTSIDANTTWDCNVFDAYCDAAILSPYRCGQFNLAQRKDDLIQMGILREYQDGWVGYNDQRMAALLAGGIYQTAQRLDSLIERLTNKGVI